jgi:hypothetical protein
MTGVEQSAPPLTRKDRPMTSERTRTAEQRVEDAHEAFRNKWIGDHEDMFNDLVAAFTTRAALAPAEARIAELEQHLSGVVHEADWMVKLSAINDIARAGLQGRFARARAAINQEAP